MRNPITHVLSGVLSGAVILSGLGLPALTSSAWADKGHGLFERSDTDGDGFVSKAEFEAGRDGMFQRIDANKDGLLTQEEMKAARDAWRAKMGKPANDNQAADQAQSGTEPAEQHRGGFMKRLDTNQDGQISNAEFAAGGEKMFAKLDANADGKIAKDEVPQRRKHQQDGQPADPSAQPAQ